MPLACLMAAGLAWWIASASTSEDSGLKSPSALVKTEPEVMPSAPAKAVTVEALAQPVLPAPPAYSDMSLDELRAAWNEAPTMDKLQGVAEELASRNSAESVKLLLEAIGSMQDWPSRSELAKNLRAVSDPATLSSLLPALLDNYGRGNTILNEISDAVGRMAQCDTVEALAVLHWQASTQAGQGHKILRTVAGIRNPPARRALARLAERSDSPALAAAAAEALKNMDGVEP